MAWNKAQLKHSFDLNYSSHRIKLQRLCTGVNFCPNSSYGAVFGASRWHRIGGTGRFQLLLSSDTVRVSMRSWEGTAGTAVPS